MRKPAPIGCVFGALLVAPAGPALCEPGVIAVDGNSFVHHVIRSGSGCHGARGAEADALAALAREAGQRATIALERPTRRGAGLNIQLLLSPEVAANEGFVAGLARAVDVWEGAIATPVTVFMAVGFTSGESFIAAASSRVEVDDYSSVRQRLVNAASPGEAALVDALPFLTLLVETGLGQTTASQLGGVRFSTAAGKALGYSIALPPEAPWDSSIVFNTAFNFDPDPSDGVTPGTVDLVFVMIHELGHALGFISSVDAGAFGPAVAPSVLDLYRFGVGGANDPATIDQFATFARELRVGTEAALDTVGEIAGAGGPHRFSTGTGGDGRQASHWKDDALLGLSTVIGVMDPTYNALQNLEGFITEADLLAFDLIGWRVVRGCPNDLNGDGFVGSADLALVFGQWGTDGSADVNGDGVVSARDLARVLGDWGGCP